MFFHEQVEKDKFDRLAKLLGLLWKKEDLLKPMGRPDGSVEELFIPLSLVIDSSLPKNLRALLLKDVDAKGKPVKELGLLSKQEFFEHYRKSQALQRKSGKESDKKHNKV